MQKHPFLSVRGWGLLVSEAFSGNQQSSISPLLPLFLFFHYLDMSASLSVDQVNANVFWDPASNPSNYPVKSNCQSTWHVLHLQKHVEHFFGFFFFCCSGMENIKGKFKCPNEPLLACRAAVSLYQEVQLIIHCSESICSVWVSHANLNVLVGKPSKLWKTNKKRLSGLVL